jgi:hypothetical protein
MGLVLPLQVDDVPEKSESGDTLITTNDIATAVKDTFINRTAINKATYPEIYGTLLSYTEGIPTNVEYFKKRESYINRQTIDTSFSGERSSILTSFDLIHNFEIRLKDQIDISVDPEATEVSIVGSAIIYPGFKPNVGDIFYLKLSDNRIGCFIVNTTQPLSIAHGSHYQIEFHFDQFLTSDYNDRLKASVAAELYFDKQKYFSDEAALLSSVSYNQYESLSKHKRALISLIVNNYYYDKEKSLLVPNNIYDDFLIEYLTNKVSINDTPKDICQIPNPYGSAFFNTIWYAFLNQDITVLLYIGYTLITYRQYVFDTNTSDIDKLAVLKLMNKYIELDPVRNIQIKFDPLDTEFKTVSYIFSKRFYYYVLKSFEMNQSLSEFESYEAFQNFIYDIDDDSRLYDDFSDIFYSFTADGYYSMSYFDTLNKATGSNNDIHLPEFEYIIYDFIVNNNIDIDYLINKVLVKFPFVKMNPQDKLYYSAFLIHLVDLAIQRIR